VVEQLYPGAEPGAADRGRKEFSARKTKRIRWGRRLWFNIAHYALARGVIVPRWWRWRCITARRADTSAAFEPTSKARVGTARFSAAGVTRLMVAAFLAIHV